MICWKLKLKYGLAFLSYENNCFCTEILISFGCRGNVSFTKSHLHATSIVLCISELMASISLLILLKNKYLYFATLIFIFTYTICFLFADDQQNIRRLLACLPLLFTCLFSRHTY